MYKIGIILSLFVLANAPAWAGDAAPTALTNKAAIELVQSHADYLWTLIAAWLVFFLCKRGLPWLKAV
jgi:ammonium transporter, Amt family